MDQHELGLFSLFFTGAFRDVARLDEREASRKGKDLTSAVEFEAFLGIEIVTSIVLLTDLAEFWSPKLFLGQKDVAATMSRNRYQTIRARLHIHPPESVSAEGFYLLSILTWVMDMALINGFSLFRKVSGSASKNVSLREFSRHVAKQLAAVHRVRMENKRRRSPPTEALQDVVGAGTSVHAITRNSTKHSNGKLVSYLCSLRGLGKKLDLVALAAT